MRVIMSVHNSGTVMAAVASTSNQSSIWENHSQLSIVEDNVLLSYLFLIWIVAVCANGVIVFGLGLQKGQLQALDLLMRNLSCSNGLLALVTFPLMGASLFAHKWIFRKSGCLIYAFLTTFFGLVSVWILVGIAGVLYFTVVSKSNVMTATNQTSYRRKVYIFIVSIYLLNFIISLLPLINIGEYGFHKHGTSCTVRWQTDSLSDIVYLILLFVLGFFVPLTAIIIIYSMMIHALHSHNKSLSHPAILQRWVTIKRKMLLMAMCVAICMILCWTPYTLVALWEVFGERSWVPVRLEATSAFLGKSSTVLTPLVHLWFTKKYRRWFKWFLCCCGCNKHRTLSGRPSGKEKVTSVKGSQENRNCLDSHLPTPK